MTHDSATGLARVIYVTNMQAQLCESRSPVASPPAAGSDLTLFRPTLLPQSKPRQCRSC